MAGLDSYVNKYLRLGTKNLNDHFDGGHALATQTHLQNHNLIRNGVLTTGGLQYLLDNNQESLLTRTDEIKPRGFAARAKDYAAQYLAAPFKSFTNPVEQGEMYGITNTLRQARTHNTQNQTRDAAYNTAQSAHVNALPSAESRKSAHGLISRLNYVNNESDINREWKLSKLGRTTLVSAPILGLSALTGGAAAAAATTGGLLSSVYVAKPINDYALYKTKDHVPVEESHFVARMAGVGAVASKGWIINDVFGANIPFLGTGIQLGAGLALLAGAYTGRYLVDRKIRSSNGREGHTLSKIADAAMIAAVPAGALIGTVAHPGSLEGIVNDSKQDTNGTAVLSPPSLTEGQAYSGNGFFGDFNIGPCVNDDPNIYNIFLEGQKYDGTMPCVTDGNLNISLDVETCDKSFRGKGIDKVKIFVDGKQVDSENYWNALDERHVTSSVDTSELSAGPHTLTIRAADNNFWDSVKDVGVFNAIFDGQDTEVSMQFNVGATSGSCNDCGDSGTTIPGNVVYHSGNFEQQLYFEAVDPQNPTQIDVASGPQLQAQNFTHYILQYDGNSDGVYESTQSFENNNGVTTLNTNHDLTQGRWVIGAATTDDSSTHYYASQVNTKAIWSNLDSTQTVNAAAQTTDTTDTVNLNGRSAADLFNGEPIETTEDFIYRGQMTVTVGQDGEIHVDVTEQGDLEGILSEDGTIDQDALRERLSTEDPIEGLAPEETDISPELTQITPDYVSFDDLYSLTLDNAMSSPDDAPDIINYSIAAHDGTPTLIHFFWGGNLPQYETQLPALNDLYLQYHDSHDLNVLGIEMYQNDPSDPYNEFHEDIIPSNGDNDLDDDIILNTELIDDEYLPKHIADKMSELNIDGQPPAVTFPVLNGTEDVWTFLQDNGLITYSDELPYTVLVDQNKIFVEDWSHFNHPQIEASVEDVLGIQPETPAIIDNNADPGTCYFDLDSGDYYESQLSYEHNNGVQPMVENVDPTIADEPSIPSLQTWESVQPGEEVRITSTGPNGVEKTSVFEVGEKPFAFHPETPDQQISPNLGSPQGKETISISNREIECDVYTLSVEETQYKYWLFRQGDLEKVARMEKLN